MNDAKKNRFLAISLAVSYLLSGFLFTTSILNVFIYSKYIWIINILVGSVAVYFGISTLRPQNKQPKPTPKNVKIDISLPLLYSSIFVVFVINSINFAAPNSAVQRLFFAILALKISAFYYYFCAVLCSIFSTLFFATSLCLSAIIIESNKNLAKIGNILLILSGIAIALL